MKGDYPLRVTVLKKKLSKLSKLSSRADCSYNEEEQIISDIGRRIVEPHGQSTSRQTAPASLIRAELTLVHSPEDLLIDQQLSDDLSDCPIPKDILQVPFETFESESSLSASLRGEGSLKNNINFGTTPAPRVPFCLL